MSLWEAIPASVQEEFRHEARVHSQALAWRPQQQADLQEQLRELNWTRVPAKADGNCFFHALRAQLRDQDHPLKAQSASRLRAMACSYLEEHWFFLSVEFSRNGFSLGTESPEEHVARMAQDKTFVEQPLVHAAAAVFGHIHCIQPRNALAGPLILGESRSGFTFRLVFDGCGHYDGAAPDILLPTCSHDGVVHDIQLPTCSPPVLAIVPFQRDALPAHSGLPPLLPDVVEPSDHAIVPSKAGRAVMASHTHSWVLSKGLRDDPAALDEREACRQTVV